MEKSLKRLSDHLLFPPLAGGRIDEVGREVETGILAKNNVAIWPFLVI